MLLSCRHDLEHLVVDGIYGRSGTDARQGLVEYKDRHIYQSTSWHDCSMHAGRCSHTFSDSCSVSAILEPFYLVAKQLLKDETDQIASNERSERLFLLLLLHFFSSKYNCRLFE
jgi:hypothetical protein